MKFSPLMRLIPAALLIMLLVILIRLYLGLEYAPSGLPDHRIGIRVVNGVGEFYDRKTNKKFVPRGNNYIRLSPTIMDVTPSPFQKCIKMAITWYVSF